MNGQIAVLGATSGIGRAVAETLISRNCRVVLCGRSHKALGKISGHFKAARGYNIPVAVWDVNDLKNVGNAIQTLFDDYDVEGLICTVGIMPSQELCLSNSADFLNTLRTNFISTAYSIELFAKKLEDKGRGFISVVSSVAGDRGRRSNYVYGASKAGLTAYLSGLRSRLFKKGILVQTVKPGFVRTRMTEHLSDGPLMANPDRIAKDIINAIEKKKDVIYTPFFWKYILRTIQIIPESIFKRLPL